MKRRRALVCLPTTPAFDRESGSRRAFNFLEFLREAGWGVACVVVNAAGGEHYLAELQRRGVAVFAGAETSWAGSSYLMDPEPLLRGGRFDLALLHFWYVAERYLPLLRRWSPETVAVVDSVDLHLLRNARQVLGVRRRDASAPLLDATFGERAARELNAYASSDAVLTVSQREADMINELALDSRLAACVPDCEDVPLSPVPWAERYGLLFIGNFRHPPNLEAVEYLLDEVVPRLPQHLLDTHPLRIVGNDVPAAVVARCRQLSGVHCVGWVPSLGPYLESSRVSVVPLLHGAGTKRKLVEALMTGTPSVVTCVAAEGLEVVDGEHVVIGSDAAGIVAGIERLVRDEALWLHIQRAGRALALRNHARKVVRGRFLALIDELLSVPRGAKVPAY